jgi:transaldolase
MALFLDSAQVEEARQAVDLGFVAGVTTNPALIAEAGRPRLALLQALLAR